jgi:hypothetical protein
MWADDVAGNLECITGERLEMVWIFLLVIWVRNLAT